MSKKVIFLTIFIIAILIAIPLVYFLYFHESTSTDSGSEIKTTLNDLKKKNNNALGSVTACWSSRP